MTAMRDTVMNTSKRTTRKRRDDSASNLPASKRLCRLGLRRNDIPKIVKLLMDAVNDDDTNQDTDGAETPTAEETEVKSVTQELQNNIGMQSILRIHCAYIALAQITLYVDAYCN